MRMWSQLPIVLHRCMKSCRVRVGIRRRESGRRLSLWIGINGRGAAESGVRWIERGTCDSRVPRGTAAEGGEEIGDRGICIWDWCGDITVRRKEGLVTGGVCI